MTKVDAEARPAPLIDTAALAAMLGDPSVRLFDCTTHLTPKTDNSGQNVTSGRADYLKGHIPSAAFIDLAQELSDTSSPHRFSVLGPEAFAAAAGRLGIGDGTRVILYDGGYNAWAARVWWMLKGYGFDNASVLDGGIIKWRHEGRPLATDPTVYPSATFTARPRPGFFADKARVAAAIDAPDVRIVNALTSEQHAGKGGVHYGRAGRIPGSCNVASRGLARSEDQRAAADRRTAPPVRRRRTARRGTRHRLLRRRHRGVADGTRARGVGQERRRGLHPLAAGMGQRSEPADGGGVMSDAPSARHRGCRREPRPGRPGPPFFMIGR